MNYVDEKFAASAIALIHLICKTKFKYAKERPRRWEEKEGGLRVNVSMCAERGSFLGLDFSVVLHSKHLCIPSL